MTLGKNGKTGEMTIHLTAEEAARFDHPNRQKIVKHVGSGNGEFRIEIKMIRTGPPKED